MHLGKKIGDEMRSPAHLSIKHAPRRRDRMEGETGGRGGVGGTGKRISMMFSLLISSPLTAGKASPPPPPPPPGSQA